MNFVRSLFYVYVMQCKIVKKKNLLINFSPFLKMFSFSSSQTISKSKFRSVFSSYNHILR